MFFFQWLLSNRFTQMAVFNLSPVNLIQILTGASNKGHGCTPAMHLNVFLSHYNIKAVATLFSQDIVKIISTSYFWYFAHVWLIPLKTKKWTSFLASFMKYKILQSYYFEYFKNAWSCPSIMKVSPYMKVWCLKCWNQLHQKIN